MMFQTFHNSQHNISTTVTYTFGNKQFEFQMVIKYPEAIHNFFSLSKKNPSVVPKPIMHLPKPWSFYQPRFFPHLMSNYTPYRAEPALLNTLRMDQTQQFHTVSDIKRIQTNSLHQRILPLRQCRLTSEEIVHFPTNCLYAKTTSARWCTKVLLDRQHSTADSFEKGHTQRTKHRVFPLNTACKRDSAISWSTPILCPSGVIFCCEYTTSIFYQPLLLLHNMAQCWVCTQTESFNLHMIWYVRYKEKLFQDLLNDDSLTKDKNAEFLERKLNCPCKFLWPVMFILLKKSYFKIICFNNNQPTMGFLL